MISSNADNHAFSVSNIPQWNFSPLAPSGLMCFRGSHPSSCCVAVLMLFPSRLPHFRCYPTFRWLAPSFRLRVSLLSPSTALRALESTPLSRLGSPALFLTLHPLQPALFGFGLLLAVPPTFAGFLFIACRLHALTPVALPRG